MNAFLAITHSTIIGVLKSVVFRRFLKDIFLDIAEYLSKQSDNTLDDTLVEHLHRALKPAEPDKKEGAK